MQLTSPKVALMSVVTSPKLKNSAFHPKTKLSKKWYHSSISVQMFFGHFIIQINSHPLNQQVIYLESSLTRSCVLLMRVTTSSE